MSFFKRLFRRHRAEAPAPPAPPAVAPLPPSRGIAVMPPPAVTVAVETPPPVVEPVAAEPVGYPEVPFERFRNGIAHIEIATVEGECLIIEQGHPLYSEFQRWGSVWTDMSPKLAPLRLNPQGLRGPGLRSAPRGRVRAVQ